MGNRNGVLTRRARDLLAFVDRYRAATEPMLQCKFFADGVHQREKVAGVVRRLVRRGLLRQVTFARGQHLLVLTHRARRTIASPHRASRPLTEQSLPVVLAIAWYCVHSGVTRLSDREFRERYPELWKPGLRSSVYYLVDTPRGLVLGMFLVDRGGTPRRLRGKLRRLIRQRKSLPRFAALMDAGHFRVTVLTGLPAQQQNLRRQLKQGSFGGVEVEIALVAELGELLTLR